MKRTLTLIVFLLFTAFSLWVTWRDGYWGFLKPAQESLWGLQISLDLVISMSLFVGWMVRDARSRGLPAALYVALCLTCGSIGALAYLLHRGVARAPTVALEPVAAPST